MSEQTKIAVLSFYSFIEIDQPEILLQKILLIGKKKYLKGTILIAKEGFNGSVSGTSENTNLLLAELIKLTNAQDVNIKTNYCAVHPFQKLKVKLKKEIITIGVKDLEVTRLKGDYIEPSRWDSFIAEEGVVLIDTRNDYEVEVGRFENAIDPKITSFRQLVQWLEQNKNLLANKKIAMYCTGGIRCEKSTAYLKAIGYDKVYHLRGGILQYLEETNNANNKWLGECFVFDDRRAVNSNLDPAECYWLQRLPK